MSNQTATISTPVLAPAKPAPAPAAARTKLILEGPIFSTLLRGGPTRFRLMRGQDDMLDAALAYACVALGGAAAICLLNFMGNAVRGTGNMALPAGVLLACVLAHIAISPILIFGFGPLPAL